MIYSKLIVFSLFKGFGRIKSLLMLCTVSCFLKACLLLFFFFFKYFQVKRHSIQPKRYEPQPKLVSYIIFLVPTSISSAIYHSCSLKLDSEARHILHQ